MQKVSVACYHLSLHMYLFLSPVLSVCLAEFDSHGAFRCTLKTQKSTLEWPQRLFKWKSLEFFHFVLC